MHQHSDFSHEFFVIQNVHGLFQPDAFDEVEESAVLEFEHVRQGNQRNEIEPEFRFCLIYSYLKEVSHRINWVGFLVSDEKLQNCIEEENGLKADFEVPEKSRLGSCNGHLYIILVIWVFTLNVIAKGRKINVQDRRYQTQNEDDALKNLVLKASRRNNNEFLPVGG